MNSFISFKRDRLLHDIARQRKAAGLPPNPLADQKALEDVFGAGEDDIILPAKTVEEMGNAVRMAKARAN